MPTNELSPAELKALLGQSAPPIILDVREDEERAIAAIPAPPDTPQLHWPLSRFMDVYEPSALAAPRVVVYCHHGVRSRRVADWLRAQGFANIDNLAGGIDAWSLEVDPGVPRY